ncbi:hypothetical protein DFH07DRAFT_763722 [Mycena maculata]|uniref:Uncharacterized protein n=1 Tax=Mycena maculata TaxID=230809 RepID=A0AAD7KH66_9AGAR|nr:hypothetical protein DFH07DRAFT_763722 [Mycena maculata]
MSERPTIKCGCDPAEFKFEPLKEVESAVLCNDGERIAASYEDVLQYYQETRSQSSWAGVWQPHRLSHLGCPQFPKEYFRGPLVANMNFPLLLVGNTARESFYPAPCPELFISPAEPVTPLWAYISSHWHCAPRTLLLVFSFNMHAKVYSGVAPRTVCPVIRAPFPTDDHQAVADAQAVLTLSAVDRVGVKSQI